ncbi:laccase with copper binding domain [Thermothelomyces thermophilus ATCC 42464]|uniref:Laccase with copper binding domain n=1 Tax=Thermothelomyces thermophilus (strain ATCC 42464 / BCRC 31852 / DSM 1799) TaxID=573729 RepID=G2Q560_THET4|nr:copper binding domain-containing laccase [Thermothelomyces thermophilus ATCC 42464]AEO54598.1 laccase with copper binding domain [Thermothelomyces thermophilus ATCC 42464]
MGSLRGLLEGVVDTALDSLYTATGSLTQSRTNGLSLLGTLLAPTLPLFLTNNSLPDGYPWGELTDEGTNPYTECPRTGVTRHYDFTVSRASIAPDGYLRDVLLVNGAFPGPLVEANWGDTIVVDVHNDITGPEEGTAIHWHGFLQHGTPWEDGVPGITQCPIPPRRSYRYEFVASLYGTSWYHSHYSAQFAGGLFGPIVIHGPTRENYDIDLGPILLTDWYHREYFDIIEEMLAPGGSAKVVSDNNLIDGKMHFDCSTVAPGDNTPCFDNAGVSKFRFQTGKTHRLRLINGGADGVQRFSIDEHTLTVIAEDFVPVKPYNTSVVTLGVGQRADVLVTANVGEPTSAFWMRSNLSSCLPARQPYAVAAVYYDQADTSTTPSSRAWDVLDPGTCTNDDLDITEPLFPIPLPEPTLTHTMDIELFTNASNVTLWKFNGVSMRADYNSPVLLLANDGNFTYPPQWNVVNQHNHTAIRIIVNNRSPSAHPMHLHGHNFYVLHEGPGEWDGTIVRPSNPRRRDVYSVRSKGHLVIQFDGAPGVWPFHCHIAWHVSGGFMATLIVKPDEVERMEIPRDVEKNCRAWAMWSKYNVVDQIDSGT